MLIIYDTHPEDIDGYHIQEQAAEALDAGRFNYPVAVNQFLTEAHLFDWLDLPQEQAEQFFDFTLDLFLANHLSLPAERHFLAALSAGT